jgi:3-hydroxyacyl-CoA dehydrogenase
LQAITDRDPGCRGIVLAAEGPTFSGRICRFARSSRAIAGRAVRRGGRLPGSGGGGAEGAGVGPGAELALAARARLGGPGLKLAFAEVTLGLCPCGGTTRRLPRLIGAGPALRLLLSGRAVPAAEALALGLIDGITEMAPVASAMRLAAALAVGDMLRRDPPDAAAWARPWARRGTGLAAQGPAARRIVDCVEAALVLPAENAQEFETVARSDLEQTEEAIGLCAAARAERRALALPPVLTRLQTLSVDRIGLVGLAPDLARIAVVALSRELAVTWSFPDELGARGRAAGGRGRDRRGPTRGPPVARPRPGDA